jgi:hypothetical protein
MIQGELGHIQSLKEVGWNKLGFFSMDLDLVDYPDDIYDVCHMLASPQVRFPPSPIGLGINKSASMGSKPL